MPKITIKVNGTYESIVRPVALGVLRDVMAATGMEDHNVESTLLGEFGAREQAGTKMGESGDVQFGASSKATVTVEDNPRYDSILNTHVRTREHPPILADKRLGIALYPVYIDSELTLNFRYTAANKEEALKWRDDYMIKRAEDRTTLYHQVMYYVPIQDGIFKLLHHLYTLREKISGYGDTFDEYIQSMQMRELTTLTGVDGNTSLGSIAIPEKQIQVTGWFDFNEPPKEEKDQGGTRWNIEFSYKCLYKRCSHFYVVYPMAVHQSHISRKYFQEETYFSYEELERYPGIQVMADEKIRRGQSTCSYLKPSDGLRFPPWDDWVPKITSDSSQLSIRPMLTWLVGLNPDDPKKIFDFTTMPELRLGLEMDTFMRENYTKLTTRRKCIVYVRLYKDDIPVDDSAVYVDENLVLRSNKGLDLRHLYHVRLSIIVSEKLLDTSAIDDLRRAPETAYVILKSLNCLLDDSKFLDNLVSDKILNRGYVEEELKHIERTQVPGGNIDSLNKYSKDNYTDNSVSKDLSSNGPWSKGSGLRTVQTLLIVSKR